MPLLQRPGVTTTRLKQDSCALLTRVPHCRQKALQLPLRFAEQPPRGRASGRTFVATRFPGSARNAGFVSEDRYEAQSRVSMVYSCSSGHARCEHRRDRPGSQQTLLRRQRNWEMGIHNRGNYFGRRRCCVVAFDSKVRTAGLSFAILNNGREVRALFRSLVLPNGVSLLNVITIEAKRLFPKSRDED